MLPDLQAQAARNHGAFTRHQAIEAGYTADACNHRLATGRWLTLRRGVYVERQHHDACGDPVERHALDVAAALLALDAGDAAASHQSAAVLHGLTLLTPPSVAVVTRPPGAPGRDLRRGVHVHRAVLPVDHLATALGLPVTGAARTAVDLARVLPFREAVVAVDSALQLGRTTRAELSRVLDECRRWPGIARARTVVAFADPAAESALESLARVMFAEQGLPRPDTQAPIGKGRPFARVDFLWLRFATIVETDGLVKYDHGDVIVDEKLRQERLERLGYKVVRLTWQQVTDEPNGSAARIRHAFGLGAADGLTGRRARW